MTTPTSKKMLINVMHPEEARVAIVHDGRLMELNVEITGKEQTKGNIYKGVVLRVEPGLQAAFIDIGRAKPGFLQVGELHPDFYQWRDDIPEEQRRRRPRIQEVLRRGQELLVQVEKDERDNKGSALTTYLSLPGRYMVIMPGSDSTGISRKVEQEGERKKLKEIVAGMRIPQGIGYIIRTEAVGRTPEELQKDLDNLVEQYEQIKRLASEIKGAGEVYRDSGLIIRSIRDYFSDSIDEVLVDDKEAYRQAKEFFRDNMPKCEKRVKLHKEKRPIFSRFQLEEQIDQIYEKRVPLPSGGSLIIEPTEALVSIDVNSGKTSGEKGVEDTAFRTNMEAAEEVARQLRLRDLGGLIVIDFIDMRDRKHNHDVERTLKQALKMDKARVNLGRISEFGILEMSRQRIAKTLNDAIHLACPHCEGRGKVKSVEAMAVSFLRKVHAAAAKGTVGEVHGGLPLEVAYYLLNRKKRELAQIENEYDIEVTVKGKTSFLLNQLELEVVKREKHHEVPVLPEPREAKIAAPAVQEELTPAETGEEPLAPQEGTAEGGKKRKRRRKKKKGTGEAASVETVEATQLEETSPTEGGEPGELAEEELPEAAPAEAEQHGETATKRKRKRRRSRKGAREQEEAASASEAAAEEAPAAPPAEQTPPSAPALEPASVEEPVPAAGQPTEEPAEAPPKTKRKRAPRKKAAAPAAEAPSEAPAASPASEVLPTPAPTVAPEPAPAPEAPKPQPAPALTGETANQTAGEEAPVEPKKARRRTPRKKAEATAPAPAVETAVEEEPKPKRTPRPRRKPKQDEPA